MVKSLQCQYNLKGKINKDGGFILLDFKIKYKPIMIKEVWY